MEFFKQKNVDLGQIKAGSIGVKVEWEFKDLKLSDLASYTDTQGNLKYAFRKSCGCTADLEFSEKGIVAKYTDTTKLGTKNKSITLFLAPKDKSIPTMIKNNKGEDIFNPILDSVVISFSVKSI